MKKGSFIFMFIISLKLCAQPLQEKLAKAVAQLEADPQMLHAIIGLSVCDGKTGRPVYEHNAQVGLAPASTQKLFTSVAAFDMLGKDYRYKTEIGYDGKIENKKLIGNLIIKGYGDPTLGSVRFKQYANLPSLPLFESIRLFPIDSITGMVYADESAFEFQSVPNGWIWEDVGNYYGAGAAAINWKENAYTLPLRAGNKIGDTVTVISKAGVPEIILLNNLVTAAAGTGDHSLIHIAPNAAVGSLEGSIPLGENNFKVEGAVPDAAKAFLAQLKTYLDDHHIGYNYNKFNTYYGMKLNRDTLRYRFIKIYTHYSPSLDSINYWFLRKSINLYGEALIKTMALEKTGFGSTQQGVDILKDFWRAHGIEISALHIFDGSGLSPQNRVTADAMLKVLQYARTRLWFNSFYEALPEYNGMKMKSGSINGARAFAGYQQAGNGNAYSFAIIINNYDGDSRAVIRKMYTLLDNLK